MKIFKNIRRYREPLLEIVCYILLIVLFVGGYQLSDKYITKEINDAQYEICNKYIHDIYANGNINIIDIPDDMYFDDRLMEVGFRHRYGCAEATFQSGKLIIERNYEKGSVRGINTLFGVLAIIIGAILKALFKFYYKEFSECKIKG